MSLETLDKFPWKKFETTQSDAENVFSPSSNLQLIGRGSSGCVISWLQTQSSKFAIKFFFRKSSDLKANRPDNLYSILREFFVHYLLTEIQKSNQIVFVPNIHSFYVYTNPKARQSASMVKMMTACQFRSSTGSTSREGDDDWLVALFMERMGRSLHSLIVQSKLKLEYNHYICHTFFIKNLVLLHYLWQNYRFQHRDFASDNFGLRQSKPWAKRKMIHVQISSSSSTENKTTTAICFPDAIDFVMLDFGLSRFVGENMTAQTELTRFAKKFYRTPWIFLYDNSQWKRHTSIDGFSLVVSTLDIAFAKTPDWKPRLVTIMQSIFEVPYLYRTKQFQDFCFITALDFLLCSAPAEFPFWKNKEGWNILFSQSQMNTLDFRKKELVNFVVWSETINSLYEKGTKSKEQILSYFTSALKEFREIISTVFGLQGFSLLRRVAFATDKETYLHTLNQPYVRKCYDPVSGSVFKQGSQDGVEVLSWSLGKDTKMAEPKFAQILGFLQATTNLNDEVIRLMTAQRKGISPEKPTPSSRPVLTIPDLPSPPLSDTKPLSAVLPEATAAASNSVQISSQLPFTFTPPMETQQRQTSGLQTQLPVQRLSGPAPPPDLREEGKQSTGSTSLIRVPGAAVASSPFYPFAPPAPEPTPSRVLPRNREEINNLVLRAFRNAEKKDLSLTRESKIFREWLATKRSPSATEIEIMVRSSIPYVSLSPRQFLASPPENGGQMYAMIVARMVCIFGVWPELKTKQVDAEFIQRVTLPDVLTHTWADYVAPESKKTFDFDLNKVCERAYELNNLPNYFLIVMEAERNVSLACDYIMEFVAAVVFRGEFASPLERKRFCSLTEKEKMGFYENHVGKSDSNRNIILFQVYCFLKNLFPGWQPHSFAKKFFTSS